MSITVAVFLCAAHGVTTAARAHIIAYRLARAHATARAAPGVNLAAPVAERRGELGLRVGDARLPLGLRRRQLLLRALRRQRQAVGDAHATRVGRHHCASSSS